MKKKKESEKFDVIIIGGGAAGMSAALWCDDLKLNALLLESKKKLGGQLHIVHNPIENHLGVTAENGKELNQVFLTQIEKRQFKILMNAEVADVNFKTKTVRLADGREFSARSMVIATGVSRRKLNVDGEDKFKDKGILESGKRDVDKVKGKTICIVGGGDAALENALILSETAATVYLIHRRKEFRGRVEFIDKVVESKKIELLMETEIVEICGDREIESVKLNNLSNNKKSVLLTDALLLRIGVEPNTQIFKTKIKLDSNGYVKVNSNCETGINKVFAIGDVANPLSPTVSTSVGGGATSAKAILNILNN